MISTQSCSQTFIFLAALASFATCQDIRFPFPIPNPFPIARQISRLAARVNPATVSRAAAECLLDRPQCDTSDRLDKISFQECEGWGCTNCTHTCGGSLIGLRWAITAAHCVFDKPIKHYCIRLGSDYHAVSGSYVEVSEIITHELYTGKDDLLKHDVTLLKLGHNINFGATNSAPRPICKEWIGENEIVNIVGWSTRFATFAGELSEKASRMCLTSMSNDDCSVMWEKISDNHICTKPHFINTNGTVCSGDSGSGLYLSRRQCIIGIVSSGFLLCQFNCYPDTYTRLSEYVPWILQKTNNEAMTL